MSLTGFARTALLATSAMAAIGLTSASAHAQQSDGIAMADRFYIGSSALAACSAQLDRGDAVATGLFDRAYVVTCRDARQPVGRLYVLSDRDADAAQRLAAGRAPLADCSAPETVALPDVSGVTERRCRNSRLDVSYTVIEGQAQGNLLIAEGLSGYESALRLALRSLALDRPVPGEVTLAAASAQDPAAFARVIASTLDPVVTRSEGYRSNAQGQYLDAAEYFGGVRSRLTGTSLSSEEISLNEALQQSNLGNYAAADRLFGQTMSIAGDPVEGRLRRNYLALHLLNQRDYSGALSMAQTDIAAVPAAGLEAAVIDETTSRRLDTENPFVQALSNSAPPPLTRAERATLLDAQSSQIAGTALRMMGRRGEARQMLTPALASMEDVRGGRISSVYWLRAQMLAELASLDEADGNIALAEARLRQGQRMMELEHPYSNATWSAQLDLAGFLARQQQDTSAYSLFRETVREATEAGQPEALAYGLGPYFALLEKRAATDPQAAEEFFTASQALVKLGVARSQFEFARILAAGSDDTAALFRTSSQISREINRLRLERARRLNAGEGELASPDLVAQLDERIARLEDEQTVVQADLNSSARYQVATAKPLSLSELRSVLEPGEVYYKVLFVDGATYGLVATSQAARIVPIASSEAQFGTAAKRLRDTLGREVDGTTYVIPYDVDMAEKMYRALLAPIATELEGARHLIFEPDGALLSLPLAMLVTDRASVDAYRSRVRNDDGDPYDFRGVNWLGRTISTSTAVSPRTLHLFRTANLPSASRNYLGLGENRIPGGVQRAVLSADGSSVCTMPEEVWENPISAEELELAQAEVSGASRLLTEGEFTDAAIKSMPDLDDFRIIHFATHGIVTPPGAECLPQPALVTSFGGEGSDGLLSFREIFGLSINADIVLLSACDTGSAASTEATREAVGELTGGGYALDGLVRSFIGAGARTVIASHWPIPEEPINATTALIGNFFAAQPNVSVADAMRNAQSSLMDSPITSHPFYWAAFAIIGDGTRPLIASN